MNERSKLEPMTVNNSQFINPNEELTHTNADSSPSKHTSNTDMNKRNSYYERKYKQRRAFLSLYDDAE